MKAESIKLLPDSKVLVTYDTGKREIKKSRGIPFKPDMMEANIAGIKTNTRRVAKYQPIQVKPEYKGQQKYFKNPEYIKKGYKEYHNPVISLEEYLYRCPYGQPGDLIYCREVFYECGYWKNTSMSEKSKWIKEVPFYSDVSPYDYMENKYNILLWNDIHEKYLYRKKPSIHMPREAARLWNIITEIRFERVQDISEADAKAEGVKPLEQNDETLNNYLAMKTGCKYKPAFSFLWDKINAKRKDSKGNLLHYSWDDNPYVWVIVYKKFFEGRAT